MSALRAYPKLRDASNLRGWLVRIARNKALDHHRRRRELPYDELPERGGGPAAPEPPDEELWDAVQELPPKQRAAVACRFVMDYSHAEIATVLDARGRRPAQPRRRPCQPAPELRAMNDVLTDWITARSPSRRPGGPARRRLREGRHARRRPADRPHAARPGPASPPRASATTTCWRSGRPLLPARDRGRRGSTTSAASSTSTSRAGARTSTSGRLRLVRGEFQRRCLERLRGVGYGQVRTYRELAEDAGNPGAVRAAGHGVRHEPDPDRRPLPPHRALDGTLGQYGGGIPRKEFLLRLEGAVRRGPREGAGRRARATSLGTSATSYEV